MLAFGTLIALLFSTKKK
ncbi:hypothetical protein [Brevibacillus humidisoli]